MYTGQLLIHGIGKWASRLTTLGLPARLHLRYELALELASTLCRTWAQRRHGGTCKGDRLRYASTVRAAGQFQDL